MKVLFIGGTGNISSACARLLHERGHEVLVVSRGTRPVPDGYTALTADRGNAKALAEIADQTRPDTVINFLGFTTEDIETDFKAFHGKTAQYVFISSATVYRKPGHAVPLTESGPTGNPFSDYAANKERSEKILAEIDDRHGFPYVIVRPSHTYSEQWIPNMVASSCCTFVKRLENHRPVFVHDDGQSLWTLTTSSDFAVGLAGLVGNDSAAGHTFHITSDEVLTWNQVYAEIFRAANISAPELHRIPTDFICKVRPEMAAKLKGDKAENAVFDNAKIKRFVPDFQAHTCFRDGIARCVDWFKGRSEKMTRKPEVDAVFDDVISAWLTSS